MDILDWAIDKDLTFNSSNNLSFEVYRPSHQKKLSNTHQIG